MNYDGTNTGGVLHCDFRNNCSFGSESFFYPTITRNINFSNNYLYDNGNYGIGATIEPFECFTVSCLYTAIIEQINGWGDSKNTGIFGSKTLSGCTGSLCYKRKIKNCELVNSFVLQSSNNGLIQQYGFGVPFTSSSYDSIKNESIKDLYFYNIISGIRKPCDYEISCSYSKGINNDVKKWTIDCNKYINLKKNYKIGFCLGTPVIKKGDSMKIFEFYCCTDILGFKFPFFIDYIKDYDNIKSESDIICCGIRPNHLSKISIKKENIESTEC